TRGHGNLFQAPSFPNRCNKSRRPPTQQSLPWHRFRPLGTLARVTHALATNLLRREWVENISASGEEDMWMRSCAVCKALMMKLRLRDTVCCRCGWKWEW